MVESRDYLEMILKTIEIFSNDGKIKANELQELLDIAEKDGEIDNNEIRVLTNVISKIQSFEMDEDLQHKLEEIEEKIKL